jgi:ATP-dependent RNA helicase HelY
MGRRRPYNDKRPRASARLKEAEPKLKVASELSRVFNQIGVPQAKPFQADDFQLKALRLIRDHDVLVSATTGSGKTWIASEAIRSCLKESRRVWYASPLKALSNSLYQEFSAEFGAENCGILTGDRKENPDAPIIVGTTEILRNQLYDAMHTGTSLSSDLVVIDEAHYLADPDRGVVWEEVLIYLPVRVRVMLLSATVSNSGEIAGWLASIRGAPPKVVLSAERPVPLEMLFLSPEGKLMPFSGRNGLFPAVKKFLRGPSMQRRRHTMDLGRIIAYLRECNLLPAIFFLKSRLDCDRALASCPPVSGRRKLMAAEIGRFLETYPHLKRHRQIKTLMESRVASHHGGQLPYWKVLIERLMSRGFLEAIFSTSTVAAGVNFPARTVVLMNSDRFNGREFADLTATEFHQMIGRAGRRGKDRVGFALVVPGPYQDLEHIQSLTNAEPEPVQSQIRINFSMTLNLLLSHRPQEVNELLERSFAAYQSREISPGLNKRWEKLVESIKLLLPQAGCDTNDPSAIADYVRERSGLRERIKALVRSGSGQGRKIWRDLEPGMILQHKNGGIYLVCRVSASDGKEIYQVCPVRQTDEKPLKKIRMTRISPARIKHVFKERLDISNDCTRRELTDLTRSIDPLSLTRLEKDRDDEEKAERLRLERMLGEMPCETCPHLSVCHGPGRIEPGSPIQEFLRFFPLMEHTRAGLWISFQRHLRFLRETGFATADGRLTPDGYWACNLRVDQPLLIAEAIRKHCLDDASPAGLASALAPFVWDRGIEMETVGGGETDEAEQVFHKVAAAIEPLRDLHRLRGFEVPPLLFWPAEAVYMWASGCLWERLVETVRANEGDLASLMTRTADHLRQVIGLTETHPKLAAHAAEAVRLILREPVYMD